MISLLFIAVGIILMFLAVTVFSLGVFPVLIILAVIFAFLFSAKFALFIIFIAIVIKTFKSL